MVIKNVRIKNWRSIRDIELDYEKVMIFIGQNNHGKSNLLSALLFFFGEIKYDELDFNQNSDELFVEVTFSNLDNYDKNQFKKYLTSENEIKVRKTANKSGQFSYNGYIQNPNEEWLKEENVSNYLKRETASQLPLYNLIPTVGRITKEIFTNAINQYIEQNPTVITFSYELETTNFLGLKNVAKGIFGSVFYIPSVKSASEELNLKGSTLFNQLYSSVIQKMSETNQDYKDAKNKIITMVKSLNKIDENGNANITRPPELNLFEQRLERELSSWNTKIEVEITPPNFDDVFKVGTSVWINDGIKTDISRKGNGLQRALIFALIKTWANIIREERDNVNTIPAEERPIRQTSNSAYFIFEEPELYLHPQAQRELFSSLVLLSASDNQILLCTHSSSFIDMNMYKSICIVKKENDTIGTTILQCKTNLFSDDDDKKNFNLVHWFNPDRSELFFSKKVVLVEGPTEKTVIPFLAKQLNIFRYDYTLIECASKDAFVPYIELLNKFRLPYIAIYDKDHQADKNPEGIQSADKSSKRIEDAIDMNYGSTIILENDIEEEIGITDKSNKSKPFFALKKVDADDFVIKQGFKDKIIKIYS
ncbi:MAG: AAA family ATPase [Ignavibacteriaceae bacterium]|nr:AAA family ATPase [Ignavibacteriaceae bacterium]